MARYNEKPFVGSRETQLRCKKLRRAIKRQRALTDTDRERLTLYAALLERWNLCQEQIAKIGPVLTFEHIDTKGKREVRPIKRTAR